MKKMIILAYMVILLIACNKNKHQPINQIPDDNNIYVSVDETIDDENVEISTEMYIQKYLNKTMYVNSSEGLRVRNLPSIDGEKIGLLDFNTEIKIISEDNISVTIDGIEGKWVKIITPIEGWVFSGYLENDEIEEINLGDFKGKYRFSAFETSSANDFDLLFDPSFDLSPFEKLNRNNFINITLKEGNIYLLETNFVSLIEIMENFIREYPMEIEYPNELFDIYNKWESKEGRIYQLSADGHTGGTKFEIYFFENKNEIVYEYIDLRFNKNTIIKYKVFFKK
jgi:hypothetical protein